MPLRFRKIIPLGKGFRINLSKSGISSSLGGKGFTLNVGKRGIRPTVGLPGTGLSFTPGQAADTTAKNDFNTNSILTMLISGILVCVISICCIGVLFTNTSGGDDDQAQNSNSSPAIIPIVPIDTQPARNNPAACTCATDSYNCGNFRTRSEAQSCFDYCATRGFSDVHKLDNDGDGNVCEALP